MPEWRTSKKSPTRPASVLRAGWAARRDMGGPEEPGLARALAIAGVQLVAGRHGPRQVPYGVEDRESSLCGHRDLLGRNTSMPKATEPPAITLGVRSKAENSRLLRTPHRQVQ